MSGSISENSSPSIGIFWILFTPGQTLQVLSDLMPFDQGEPYGDFLTYGGHYEHWERLAKMGARQLRRCGLPTAPAWSEYEEWPRGRVIFHVPTRRFVVYADRKLWQQPILGLVLARFGLMAGMFDLRGDQHYVSVRSPEAVGLTAAKPDIDAHE